MHTQHGYLKFLQKTASSPRLHERDSKHIVLLGFSHMKFSVKHSSKEEIRNFLWRSRNCPPKIMHVFIGSKYWKSCSLKGLKDLRPR